MSPRAVRESFHFLLQREVAPNRENTCLVFSNCHVINQIPIYSWREGFMNGGSAIDGSGEWPSQHVIADAHAWRKDHVTSVVGTDLPSGKLVLAADVGI
jgi:hypothetical protein